MTDEWNRYSHLFEDGEQIISDESKRQHARGLIDEPGIPVYPTIATLIGINEAVILQQVHFLCNGQRLVKNKYNFINGRWWVYNSYKEWREDFFPWLSEVTIRRILTWHESNGYLLSMQSVKNKSDRRKWYSLDAEKWNDFLADTIRSKRSHQPSDQKDHMVRSKRSDGYSKKSSKKDKDSIPPDGVEVVSTRKPRKRNEMCDAVTEHLFETALGSNPETERIAAMTGVWLSGGKAPKNLNIAPLETPLVPTDVLSIARFFRRSHPDAQPMRSITAAVRWTHDWIAAGKPSAGTTNGNGQHNPFANVDVETANRDADESWLRQLRERG